MAIREGNLSAPDRQPLGWDKPEFWDRDKLNHELERVFDICHGCRRCVNLCDSFPTLFDLVDESPTLEVDGVDKADYMKVVDQCFLCDLCAETKCPYLPPHEWSVDFPHLMLRAKAQKFRHGDTKWRDRIITSTDPVFDAISIPGFNRLANLAAMTSTRRLAAAPLARSRSTSPVMATTTNPG
jgi:ferredoxin